MVRPTHKYAVIDNYAYNLLNKLSHKLKKIKCLHPNHITLTAYPFIALLLKTNNNYLLAFCFFMICLIDCLDGEFARVTGKVSKFGEKLDHYTDRITNCIYNYLFFSLFMDKSTALKSAIAIQIIIILWFICCRDKISDSESLNNNFYLVFRFIGACIYFYLKKKLNK